ncbi:MAG: C45 family autoproteolytic acyltransferase/hydrolase [Pseudomonadales bacterium]
MKKLDFHSIEELQPGEELQRLFARNWPAYKTWFLSDGDARRPNYLACHRAIDEHMPELLPVYEVLMKVLQCNDAEARFLSLYQPPPVMSGCSQLIWPHESGALIRNYDYPPKHCDGIVMLTEWTGTRVLGMTDCLWGLLDGINEHGLAASLAFGGRAIEGHGFGVSLVLRYILETCNSTQQALTVLARVPVHMDYNIALIDETGHSATVLLSPDRGTEVTDRLVSTNRQHDFDPIKYKPLADTNTREKFLQQSIGNPNAFLPAVKRDFLHAPLYRHHHQHNAGTLYTAAYSPANRHADYLWPDSSWSLSLSDFEEQSLTVTYN